jgi:hypothetical protein
MDYNNTHNIQSLLEKYWEGETSLSEESQLFDYFNSGQVAQELKTFQPMFQYFKAEKAARIESDDFESRLLAELEASTIVPIRSRRRGIIRTLGRVAAIALLVLVAYMGYQQASDLSNPLASGEKEYIPTEEERQAYETTKMALLYVSAKLNKGTKIATDNFKKVQEKAKEGTVGSEQ